MNFSWASGENEIYISTHIKLILLCILKKFSQQKRKYSSKDHISTQLYVRIEKKSLHLNLKLKYFFLRSNFLRLKGKERAEKGYKTCFEYIKWNIYIYEKRRLRTFANDTLYICIHILSPTYSSIVFGIKWKNILFIISVDSCQIFNNCKIICFHSRLQNLYFLQFSNKKVFKYSQYYSILGFCIHMYASISILLEFSHSFEHLSANCFLNRIDISISCLYGRENQISLTRDFLKKKSSDDVAEYMS